MTREEAIVMQKAMRDNLHETGKDYPYRDDMIPLMKESCNMAIQALEQEPCEDCISRQTLDEIKELMTDINGDTVYAVRMSDLRPLPHVTPQPKTGHWIIIDDCEKFIAKCSECGRKEDSRMIGKYPYCHCGAKMVKPLERNDME